MSTTSTEITDSQLDGIYQFAIDLGKKAGAMLMDGIHTRMGGTISDKSSTSTTNANMTSNLAFEEKDNAGLVFAIDPEDLPRYREKIRKFWGELSQMAEANPQKKKVYALSISLFNLTGDKQ